MSGRDRVRLGQGPGGRGRLTTRRHKVRAGPGGSAPMRSLRRDAETVRQVPLQWPGAIPRLRWVDCSAGSLMKHHVTALAPITGRSTKPASGCTLSLTTKGPLQKQRTPGCGRGSPSPLRDPTPDATVNACLTPQRPPRSWWHPWTRSPAAPPNPLWIVSVPASVPAEWTRPTPS